MITADAIVLDIEGTTTPIAFVHDVLFAFASTHLAPHLAHHDVTAAFRSEYETDPDRPTSFELESYIRWLIDRDRKSTALKALQGDIWRGGYESGELRSIVYDDVPPALAAWRDAGITIAIYSSGSIAAQQLLFRHTTHGDLTPSIARYFDTTTGPKRASASYATIMAALGGVVVFVSDVVDELVAAHDAGMIAVLSVRPGNAPVSPHPFPSITSFAELVLQRA
ncbi:MAG TPA: acireductone synthase [Kofleriaceae bacterium]|nr:acireductone synthase [Kofleriaceae bacterium]